MGWTRKPVSWAASILAAPAGVAVGAAAFFGSAAVGGAIPVMAGVAAFALVITTGGLTLLSGRPASPTRRRVFAFLISGTTLLAAVIVSAHTVFRPLDFPGPPAPPADTSYWELSTGSRLAYDFFPPDGSAAARETPVILLHGGPGGPYPPEAARRMAEPLTREGFTVYYYDQVGAGRSERLPNVSGYTVERNVADLEAIRQEIGAGRLILIGGSWGAELAGHYMAAHPGIVERAVLFSPGGLWPHDDPGTEPSSERQDPGPIGEPLEERIAKAYASPRFLAWNLLFDINPRAAHRFAPDREMDALFTATLEAAFANDREGRCEAPATAQPPPPLSAGGWYAANATSPPLRDPRPILAGEPAPALILWGECETAPVEDAREYERSLPNATLLEVPGAGHRMLAERFELFNRTTRAFLMDEPLPDELREVRPSR